ncbi:MAG: hypothetical protein D6707_12825 [Bacteroidetes bacterium]|nr:MAG: hypothetical protein D6707_12825 [Bacteroidota bacterium]
MKQYLFFFLSITCFLVSKAQNNKNDLHLLGSSEMVEIYVHKTLYEQDKHHYLMGFTIVNKHDKPVGTSFTNGYWEMFFPNHWIVHDKSNDEFALEKQNEKLPLDRGRKENLLWDFKTKKMTIINPGDSLTYYRFVYEKKKYFHIRRGEVISIGIDGQMFFTDGEKCEEINCYEEEKVNRIIDLEYPLTVLPIPPNAFVIYKEEYEEH